MVSLVIDIGNTFTKIGVFQKYELLYKEQLKSVDTAFITELLSRYQIDKVILSNSSEGNDEWISDLAYKVPLIHFDWEMADGIINHYQPPGTLGLDRLAGVIGVNKLFPGENSLVIDGGTCITYDWIDFEGNYYGGSISPGLSMRYKALNYYTSGLPLISTDENFTAGYGSNTASAIHSGVQNGLKYELNGFIDAFKNKYKLMNIVLTGGDGIFLIPC